MRPNKASPTRDEKAVSAEVNIGGIKAFLSHKLRQCGRKINWV